MEVIRSRAVSIQFWVKLLAGVVAVLLVAVWEHVEALRLDRHLKTLRKDADRMLYENSRMQAQINQWISPSHLDRLAKEQFHMALPDPKHLLGIQE